MCSPWLSVISTLGAIASIAGLVALFSGPSLNGKWKAGIGVLLALMCAGSVFGFYQGCAVVPDGTAVIIVPQSPPVILSQALPTWGNPVEGSDGSIDGQGNLKITGLKPNSLYHLCLNGKGDIPPGDMFKKEKAYKCCTPEGDGWWDFSEFKTDADGNLKSKQLEVVLPSRGWSWEQLYNVKFFIKDAEFGIVLYKNDFLFKIQMK